MALKLAGEIDEGRETVSYPLDSRWKGAGLDVADRPSTKSVAPDAETGP
jgi:hypothetical protein